MKLSRRPSCERLVHWRVKTNVVGTVARKPPVVLIMLRVQLSTIILLHEVQERAASITTINYPLYSNTVLYPTSYFSRLQSRFFCCGASTLQVAYDTCSSGYLGRKLSSSGEAPVGSRKLIRLFLRGLLLLLLIVVEKCTSNVTLLLMSRRFDESPSSSL